MANSLRPLPSGSSVTTQDCSKIPERQKKDVTEAPPEPYTPPAPGHNIQGQTRLSSSNIKVHNKEPASSIDSILTLGEKEQIDSVLTPSEKMQVAWVQDNQEYSPESKVPKKDSLHPEIYRARNRLHCLNLLRSGKEQDYRTFISPQTDKGVLTRDGFNALSELFKNLSDMKQQALRVATILSSVTLSPTAKKIAAQHLENVPTDSVKFLSATVPFADKIYPLAQELCEKFKEYEASPNAID